MSTGSTGDHTVRILVVDDEPSSVEELVFTLNAAGLSAVGASSAHEGLETFLRNHSIGVVVSDIRMPTQDGIGLLQKIRRCGDRGAACEVILMTGFPEIATAIDAIDLRVAKYFLKPFEPDEMLAAVSAAVSQFQSVVETPSSEDRAVANLVRILSEKAQASRVPASRRDSSNPPGSLTGTVSLSEREERRIATIKSMLKFHDTRSEILPQEIFGDPAWFMLLELALIDRSGKRTSVSGLCMSAKSSQTTALRRIQDMVEAGLIIRRNDTEDRRRTYITLSPEAREKLDILFDRISCEPLGRGQTTNSDN